MTDIITTKSEKGRAILDYLTRELGLPGNLRSLKVDVSSGVFVVDCQFLAPGDSGRASTDQYDGSALALDQAKKRLEEVMSGLVGIEFSGVRLVTTEVTRPGDALPRFRYRLDFTTELPRVAS